MMTTSPTNPHTGSMVGSTLKEAALAEMFRLPFNTTDCKLWATCRYIRIATGLK